MKPNRLSAREREWAGSKQPPVDFAWMTDVDTMARAQLSSLSALEWILGVLFDSVDRASPAQLSALKEFAVRELHQSINFGGALLASSTLARRKAILDGLSSVLPQNTRNWLQLQPVGLQSSQGLFGTASAQVPEIIRQLPPPPRPAAPPRRFQPRPAPRERERPRAPYRPPVNRRGRPSATYTPAAAARGKQGSAPGRGQAQSSKPAAAKPKQRS